MSKIKVALFRSKIETLLAIFILLAVFIFNIGLEYYEYKHFSSRSVYETTAQIVSQYKKSNKNNKQYNVLRIKSYDGFELITTSWDDIKDISSRDVDVKIFTKGISFFDYLKLFFAPVFDISLKQKQENFKDKIATLIANQHKNSLLKEFYLAIFLGKSPSKGLREKIQFLGISHLLAISGFHLSILSLMLYSSIYPLYRFFQDRYFPYRNSKIDITVVVLFLLFCYTAFVGFLPSVVRSFVMIALGFLFYLRAINIFSFKTLLCAVVIILSIFPRFIFSIGFWFSVLGVFYIYLFLLYFSHIKKWKIAILLNFWTYIMMAVVVHNIFSMFSVYQITSPFATLAFEVLYPLSIILHILGLGGIADNIISSYFNIDGDTYVIKTPTWMLIAFLFLSSLFIAKTRVIKIIRRTRKFTFRKHSI